MINYEETVTYLNDETASRTIHRQNGRLIREKNEMEVRAFQYVATHWLILRPYILAYKQHYYFTNHKLIFMNTKLNIVLLRDDNGDSLRCRAGGNDRDTVKLLSLQISLKIRERTKGRLGPGRLCVVPTHFSYYICTIFVTAVESLYHSKPHSISLPFRSNKGWLNITNKNQGAVNRLNHHKLWRPQLIYYHNFGWQIKLKIWVRAVAVVCCIWHCMTRPLDWQSTSNN
jgi:hypothetical protein